LKRQIELKRDERRRTMDARQSQGFDAARRIVETHLGAEAMRALEQSGNAGQCVMLAVTDTGMGMAGNHRQIF
jgi:CHASE3 domain sensor protein